LPCGFDEGLLGFEAGLPEPGSEGPDPPQADKKRSNNRLREKNRCTYDKFHNFILGLLVNVNNHNAPLDSYRRTGGAGWSEPEPSIQRKNKVFLKNPVPRPDPGDRMLPHTLD
jgi:hypothetical protein